MDGCGGFVDGEVGGENGLLLMLGSCWFEGGFEEFVFAFGTVTLMRLVPFIGARKTEEYPGYKRAWHHCHR